MINSGSVNTIILTAVVVFFIGVLGLVRGRSSLVSALIAIELMFLSVSLLLIACWLEWRTSQLPAFTMFVLGLSAAEVAVGLALIFGCFSRHKENGFSNLRSLKE